MGDVRAIIGSNAVLYFLVGASLTAMFVLARKGSHRGRRRRRRRPVTSSGLEAVAVMTRNTETEVLKLFRSRAGRATRVIAMDGEPMEVRDVVQGTAPSRPAAEFVAYARRGGIPLSADRGRYFFYSNEVARIEDVESGDVIFTRWAD